MKPKPQGAQLHPQSILDFVEYQKAVGEIDEATALKVEREARELARVHGIELTAPKPMERAASTTPDPSLGVMAFMPIPAATEKGQGKGAGRPRTPHTVEERMESAYERRRLTLELLLLQNESKRVAEPRDVPRAMAKRVRTQAGAPTLAAIQEAVNKLEAANVSRAQWDAAIESGYYAGSHGPKRFSKPFFGSRKTIYRLLKKLGYPRSA